MLTKFYKILASFKDLPLLFIRLTLAVGFFGPAKMKLQDIHAIGQWFESIGIPFPMLNAYLATFTESSGVVLLVLGLFTRLISIPLMITMLVAIFTVHFANGFAAGNNGYEIPLYYLIMLFMLLVYGAGKYSVDYFIDKKQKS